MIPKVRKLLAEILCMTVLLVEPSEGMEKVDLLKWNSRGLKIQALDIGSVA